MVSRRNEVNDSQFSWSRTSAISFAVVLHAFAFMIVLAPIMPPEAKAFVPDDITVVDIVQRPPPEKVLPSPPKMPDPPQPRIVEDRINPPELSPAVELVVEEISPMADVALPSNAQVSSEPTEVAPAVISYLRYNKPPYPAQAVRMRHEGEVMLRVLVGVDGSVIEIKVEQSSGFGELDRAAIKAARGWRFNPGTRDGIPYEGWARVPVDFTLHSY